MSENRVNLALSQPPLVQQQSQPNSSSQQPQQSQIKPTIVETKSVQTELESIPNTQTSNDKTNQYPSLQSDSSQHAIKQKSGGFPNAAWQQSIDATSNFSFCGVTFFYCNFLIFQIFFFCCQRCIPVKRLIEYDKLTDWTPLGNNNGIQITQ